MLGCNIGTTSVGEEQTETQSIELGSAETVEVVIQFGAGELDISGGAANLMEGTFTYNVDEWQPEVEYSVDGTQGTLAMSHEGDNLPVGGEVVNDWNLQFNNDVPIELTIQTGGSESVLDLSAIDITALTVEAGAGVTTIDLTGSWNHDVAVSVSGGVGEITINLPAGMGVQVNASTGLVNLTTSGLTKRGNTYTNDAFGTAPYTLTLDLEAGVGSVNLAVAD
jgi:hypothetical protein